MGKLARRVTSHTCHRQESSQNGADSRRGCPGHHPPKAMLGQAALFCVNSRPTKPLENASSHALVDGEIQPSPRQVNQESHHCEINLKAAPIAGVDETSSIRCETNSSGHRTVHETLPRGFPARTYGQLPRVNFGSRRRSNGGIGERHSVEALRSYGSFTDRRIGVAGGAALLSAAAAAGHGRAGRG